VLVPPWRWLVADFESKLRWLSERGNPVGAEELIERIEADLAGDPLVVIAKRREGTLMTKTRQPQETGQASRFRGPAWAVAAFVAILAVAALYLAFVDDDDQVAEPTPTTVIEPNPTTVTPDVETMTDLETIEAGVAAFYSGDAERAVELFELPDRTDDEIRQEAAYQAAIDGRLSLNCTESTPGKFNCSMPYHNAITDVAGDWFGPNPLNGEDRIEVVVEDGVITEFSFPEHPAINLHLGSFLATEGRLDGYEDCAFGPLSESCAAIQLENLDAWAEWSETMEPWSETMEPATLVDAALRAWYGGDCLEAHYIGGEMLSNGYMDGANALCPPSASSSQTIEYESILGADVSVEACEEGGAVGGEDRFGHLFVPWEETFPSCEVHYSNAMNAAVGKSPSVTVRAFGVVISLGLLNHWYEDDPYPEDTELRESFRLFAEGGELQDEYADAGCAAARTPECANLIMDNLDEWAAWYGINS
jgi:hypothetical protein